MLERFAGGQLVEHLVRERLAGVETTPDLENRAVVEPGGCCARSFHRYQGLIEGYELGTNPPLFVAQQLTKSPLHAAARAATGVDATGSAAVRAAAPEAGFWTSTGRAQGLLDGAAPQWRDLLQPTHLAHRWAQAVHHGVPVVSEIMAGPNLAQMAQVIDFQGRQVAQVGPSVVRTLTGRRRSQTMQVSWLAGSVTRHEGHKGSPMLIAGPGLSDGATSCTRFGTGFGHAVSAETHAVPGFDQRDHSSAVGAWRPDDVRGPGITEPLDEAQHRRDPRLGAGTGEQFGPLGQSPGQLLALTGIGHRIVQGSDHDVSTQCWIDPVTTSITTSVGSRPSPGGHWSHRGRPSRSRNVTGRVLPQAVQGSRTGPHTPQYQSSPRRCRVRSALLQLAQTGEEIWRRRPCPVR